MADELIIIDEFKKNNRTYCHCQCSCGKIFSARKDNIKSGHTKSCGCKSSRVGRDLTGEVFNHLTVIEKTDKRNASGSIIWKCKCDCSSGAIVEVDANSLIRGKTQSYGCLTSKGEEKIARLLSEHNIPFEKQKTFDSCRFPKTNYLARFDFYIDNRYLIEFDGIQHSQEVLFFKNNSYLEIVNRDLFKEDWCKRNNIPLIRISYTQLDSLTIDDLLLEIKEGED